MKNALILLAGGSGKRTGLETPKQFIKIGNTNLIEYFLSNLEVNVFDIIVIAAKNEHKKQYLKSIKNKFSKHKIIFSSAGDTRQMSVKYSLKKIKNYKIRNVLIHDSARPLVTNKLIKKIIKKLDTNFSCIPYTTSNDLIRYKKKYLLKYGKVLSIQTPQGFKFKQIFLAHEKIQGIDAKDDSSVFENLGFKLNFIRGETTNLKITSKQDFKYFDLIKIKDFRSGIGYDIHRIDHNSKRKLILCGVKILHPPLIGHSDADVGYHAICDSILGSLSMRDMGYYFNNKDLKWKNINSKIFIEFCQKELIKKGYKVINLDINFICETPNINKLSNIMKKNISKLLKISTNIISIKATTNEKISLIGKGEGIAAESIVQISNV